MEQFECTASFTLLSKNPDTEGRKQSNPEGNPAAEQNTKWWINCVYTFRAIFSEIGLWPLVTGQNMQIKYLKKIVTYFFCQPPPPCNIW